MLRVWQQSTGLPLVRKSLRAFLGCCTISESTQMTFSDESLVMQFALTTPRVALWSPLSDTSWSACCSRTGLLGIMQDWQMAMRGASEMRCSSV